MKRRTVTFEDSPENKTKALNSALRFLSRRARSEKEVQNNLSIKGFQSSTIEYVIERLNKLRFLDNKDFAHSWTRNRQEYNKKGKSVIKQELRAKGVDETLIEEALDNAQDDFQTALQLRGKLENKYNLKEPKEAQKAAAYLARRGFSWDIIKKIINSGEE